MSSHTQAKGSTSSIISKKKGFTPNSSFVNFSDSLSLSGLNLLHGQVVYLVPASLGSFVVYAEATEKWPQRIHLGRMRFYSLCHYSLILHPALHGWVHFLFYPPFIAVFPLVQKIFQKESTFSNLEQCNLGRTSNKCFPKRSVTIVQEIGFGSLSIFIGK